MADRVQALVCAGLVAALVAPARAEFSHRVHLARKLDCVVCHAPAWSSTRSTENLLPSPAICLGCHTGEAGKGPKLATPPSIKSPRGVPVARFNHQLHAKMGNVAAVIARAMDAKTYLSDPGDARKFVNTKHVCVGCHRGLEVSEAVTAAAFPRMADCLVCHSQIDPPFSCTKCHAEEARLKPADHTSDWIDVHSAGKIKDKTGCAVCHGRRFTCLGCH